MTVWESARSSSRSGRLCGSARGGVKCVVSDPRIRSYKSLSAYSAVAIPNPRSGIKVAFLLIIVTMGRRERAGFVSPFFPVPPRFAARLLALWSYGATYDAQRIVRKGTKMVRPSDSLPWHRQVRCSQHETSRLGRTARLRSSVGSKAVETVKWRLSQPHSERVHAARRVATRRRGPAIPRIKPRL